MPQIEGVAGIPVYQLYEGIPNQPGHKVDGSRVPMPVKLSLVCRTANGDTFRAGEKIVLDVVFSAPVRALNNPQASLWFDGAGESVWRGTKYVSGSGTSTLRFAYEVQPGDRDAEGLLIGAKDAQGLGEGKVKALNHDVDAIHTSNEWRPGYKVNGQPYVENVAFTSSATRGDGVYGQGEYVEITVSFDREVEKDGDVKLGLGIEYPEDEPKYAAYVSGSGTQALN